MMIQCIHSAPDSWGQRCTYNISCPHQGQAAWGNSCEYDGIDEALPLQWRVHQTTYPQCHHCGTTVTEGSTCPSCGEGI